MNTINIIIADDHAIVRTGLVALMELASDISVVGEADDGEYAVKLAKKLKPDVVIMDIMMPAMDGVTATRLLKASLPNTKILILTTSNDPNDLSAAAAAGADGILLKTASNENLISAIRSLMTGESAFSAEIKSIISLSAETPTMTKRQITILDYASRGLSNRDIAKLLSIREDSVKQHFYVICEKLGATNRTEAVAIALRKHLLKI